MDTRKVRFRVTHLMSGMSWESKTQDATESEISDMMNLMNKAEELTFFEFETTNSMITIPQSVLRGCVLEAVYVGE